jgi:hypothetical protein
MLGGLPAAAADLPVVPMPTAPELDGPATSADGLVSVSREASTVDEAHLVTVQLDPPAGNLRLGRRLLLLAVTDGVGNPVTTFERPLVITLRPSPDDLAAVLQDFSVPPVAALDPDTGAFTSLPIVWGADGTLTVSVDRLGVVTNSSENDLTDQGAPTEPVDDPWVLVHSA